MLDHDAIRKRVEAASPGPWEYQDIDSVGGGRICDTGVEIASIQFDVDPVDTRIHRFRSSQQADNDGEFIANARVDIVDLLDENEKLRTENAGLQEVVRKLHETATTVSHLLNEAYWLSSPGTHQSSEAPRQAP